MDCRAGIALRWARALVLATVAFGAGTLGHLSAGGLLPGPVGLVVVFGLLAALSARHLRAPASRLRVVVLTVVGQTSVHVALTAMAGHHGDRVAPAPAPARVPVPAPTGPWDRDAILHASTGSAGSGLAVPEPLQHVLADLTGDNAPMALAHLAAAVLVGLWLAVLEQSVWLLVAATGCSLVTALRLLVSVLLGRPAAPARPAAPVSSYLPVRCRSRVTLLGDRVTRRGPPALLAA